MKFATFGLDITATGPVVTQSSALGEFGVDSLLAQTRGHYYLPGTLVKGLLREAMTELESLGAAWSLSDWFGQGSGDEEGTGGVDPWRGRLQIVDLLHDLPAKDDAGTRYRIRMDEQRGSVDKGAYLVIEAPFASGEQVTFRGKVRMRLKDAEDAGEVRKALLAGLRWISAAGAERTAGFGHIHDAHVGNGSVLDLDSAVKAVPARGKAPSFLRLTLRPEDPLCIAQRRVSRNLFECEEHIPGAALRGAIAAMAEGSAACEPLLDNLHLVRITHALPANENQPVRTPRAPLSLCRLPGHSDLQDVRLLRDAPTEFDVEPAFDIDWKKEDWDKLPSQYKTRDLDKELRVRTAIFGEARRAKDNQLFAYRVIPPGQCVWIADVDLTRITDDTTRSQVVRCLKAFEQLGLWGLGKTKACAAVTLDDSVPPVAPVIGKQGFLSVILATPALLVDPRPLTRPLSRDEYRNLLQQAWDHQAGKGILELFNWFQRLSLAGSHYLAERFQPSGSYRPWLLSAPGSIFVFQVNDVARAKESVEKWLQQGLKPFGKGFYFDDDAPSQLWRNCPYIPENGYGEVRVEWTPANS
jgi:hypothetical protein